MNRGNKLWEGHRMIIPEHRAFMLGREDSQMERERPALDEDRLEEMNRTLSEAVQEGRLVTLTVFHPLYDEEVCMVPQRMKGEQLWGLAVSGEAVGVRFLDIVGVE